MAIQVVRAPAGVGKTQRALNQISQLLEQEPFAQIWVVLASKRQENAFRQRLIDLHTSKPVFFNVEFFNFYELYDRLLDMAHAPQRLLSDSAQHTLLRSLIAQVAHRLMLFDSICHTPGFVRVVQEFITELKQNRIYPNEFSRIAVTARDRDLALIYSVYQDYLTEHLLADIEGQGWLASEVLGKSAELVEGLSLLVIDGFDQFNVVQADLVGYLAQSASETLITLPHVAELSSTVGRRFTEAYDLLRSRLGKHMLVDLPVSAEDRSVHNDMRHIAQNVFRYPVMQRRSEGGLRLIEAPDEAEEVAAVLREIKRLLLDKNTTPDDIIVILRHWGAYQPHFSSLRERYGLPLVLHYGEPLGQNPVIIALMELLQLHRVDFRRRELLTVLRSPYFDVPLLDQTDVELLDRISLEYAVTQSKRLWEQAINQAVRNTAAIFSENEEAAAISEVVGEQLKASLGEFMAAITPPDEATPLEYALWLNTLVGVDPLAELPVDEGSGGAFTLNVLENIRTEGVTSEIIDRDLMAIQEFKRILHGIVSANTLIATLDRVEPPPVTWDAFFTELQGIINRAALNPRPARFGRVLVTSAVDARGLPHKHVFILGLSEGGFPSPIPEDPLYLDHERQSLNFEAVKLPTRAERASDDALFYQLVSLPRNSLTLSRPSQQGGTLWAASPFWRAVAAIFTDAEELIARNQISIGAVASVNRAASRDELALALVTHDHIAATTLAWLQQAHPDFWQHIAYGNEIEQRRRSRYDQYTGKITEGHLLEVVRDELGPGRVWSASQFNDYGVCGFRFFAKRLLRLEAIEEPEEGMDYPQRGTLIHEILEQTYRELVKQNLEITPETTEFALNTMRRVAEEVFDAAPFKLGFQGGPLWAYQQNAILGRLERFIMTDFSDIGDNPLHKKIKYQSRRPYLLEVDFGGSSGEGITLWLEGVGKVRVRGVVDRVDVLDDKDALVIDYKSGSAPSVGDLQDGRNYQMLVYLEGVRQILAEYNPELEVRGGVFWQTAYGDVKGELLPLDEPKHEEAVDTALKHLADQISSGRAGEFPVYPKKVEERRCVRYCEFSQLCRMDTRTRFER